MSDQVKIGVGVTGAHKVEDDFRRINAQLEKTAALLSKISGRSLSGVDAGMAEHTFSGLRRVSSGLRGYSGLNDFIDSPAATLRDATARGRAYRDRVLGTILDGAAREHGAGWRVTHAAAAGAGGGAGGGGSLGSGLLSGFTRNMGGLGKLAMGGGAFAVGTMGAEAVMGVVKRAVGAIADEATAIDSLKRRTGDLGMGFGRLMDEAHKAADGLGVTYAESAKLANAMTRVAGNFKGGDLRAAIGFARASGMDIGASVDFFGSMRRVGDIGSAEGQMKRFAYLIGQAVSASGYSGQVEQITRAVAQYATTSARFGLSSPNFGGYLGALTGLTRTGIPGLDPEGAAALLSRADSTIRAGGGGRWGTAFLMQALGGGTGDPYATQALWQQGMFGSSAQAFSGPWAQMVRQFGGRVPLGNGTANFSRIRDAFKRVMAGTGSAAPAAFAQLLGLPSVAQGAALFEMRPATLDLMQNTLQKYGVKLGDVSSTGMADFGAITQARGVAGLLAVRDQILGRGDLSGADRRYLSNLNGGMSEGTIRQALGRFALTREQEDTPTTILRRWATDTTDAIYGMGDKLLGPLNGILTAVNHMAGIDTILGSGYQSSGNAPLLGASGAAGKASLAAVLRNMGAGAKFSALAMAIAEHESSFNPGAKSPFSSAAGLFQFTNGTWAQFGAGGSRGVLGDNILALANEYAAVRRADHGAEPSTTELLMAHRFGLGHRFDMPPSEIRGEAQRVEHFLTVNVTNNGKTVSTTRLPLTGAGAPIVPAGGGTIVAPGPM
jgi:Transglycosylase SLT domain